MKQNKTRAPWAPGDVLSLLFPQRCPFCDGALPFRARLNVPLTQSGPADPWIHPRCFPQDILLREPLCMKCGRSLGETGGAFCRDCRERSFHFKQNRAVWQYTEPARSAVTRFKYHGRQQYAVYFARAWLAANREYLEQIRPDVLIPVPIHRPRLRKRGYNQASLLAYELEKLTGIPCREDLVIRTKHTGAQKDLGPAERLRNMENAFRLKKPPEGIARVLIIDDIFTTGSTLETLSRLLLDAGVPEVYSATLCVAGDDTYVVGADVSSARDAGI
nr:ComF family protein [Lachnospiraceae bacterium]